MVQIEGHYVFNKIGNIDVSREYKYGALKCFLVFCSASLLSAVLLHASQVVADIPISPLP